MPRWMDTDPLGKPPAARGAHLRRRALWMGAMATGAVVGLTRACWRGEVPLWLATTLFAAVCFALNPLWQAVDDAAPTSAMGWMDLAVLSGWAACLWAAFIWTGIGFWRSLRIHLADGGSTVLAIVAVAVMVAAAWNTWSSARPVSCYAGSLWGETWAGHAPGQAQDHAVMGFDAQTRTLWVRGEIVLGTAQDFLKALAAHPSVRTIGLISPGGYVHETQAMVDAILKRRLDTYAPGQCMSACVALFAAGEQRWVSEESEFGLHRSGHECREDSGPTQADLRVAQFLRDRGVSESVVDRFLETPNQEMWSPDIGTTLRSGLATGTRGYMP